MTSFFCRRTSVSLSRFLLLLLALCLGGGCSGGKTGANAQINPPATAVPVAQMGAPEWKWDVLGAFPHDTRAFTEGLLWHEGKLYESTGLEGQSSLRRVDLQSGTVEKKLNLPSNLFGEGLSWVGGKFYQLTWQTKLGFVYDDNFKLLSKFSYTDEGWGLTTDGNALIQSDGTDTLTWRDPKNFAALRQVKVTWDGQPQRNLNELEWIGGKVWANIWQQDQIVVINPTTGKVEAYLNLSTIIPDSERGSADNVLNGIAYDPANQRLFVTGKNWPKLYWIHVQDKIQ